MRTDGITVGTDNVGIDMVVSEVERFADHSAFERREIFCLRLLAEEMMEVIKCFTAAPEARFRIENDGKDVLLVVEADSRNLGQPTAGASDAPDPEAGWGGLKRSIIESLADEVIVDMKPHKTQIMVRKKFAEL